MFNWDKVFSRRNWQNKPSQNTPLSANNLNAGDYAVNELDNRVIELNKSKLDVATANTMVKDVTLDESTGVFTVTKLNGTTFIVDTKLEKIATNWTYNKDTQQIVLTLDDGTKEYIDLSTLVTQYEFLDSDTIGFQVQPNGKIKAIVIDGSITDNKLQPNYLADVTVQAQNALSSANSAASSADAAAYDAKLSQSYAVGGSGIRDGENTDNAKYYKEQAQNSSDSASSSASSALTSSQTATTKASEAATSSANAKTSEINANASETAAKTSETNAKNSEINSFNSASEAAQSETNSENNANLSKSYSVGTDGVTRPNDNVDCAKYYYEQARQISEGLSGGLLPMGTITFSQLASQTKVKGYMYNISDEFVTDETFKEGAGLTVPAGSNVYWTTDGYWDILAGSPVTGIKGDNETIFRRGNVNITADNLGALKTDGDAKDTTVTFAQATARTNVASGDKMSTLFGKIAKWFTDLKAVAFTGSYNDLSDKPTIDNSLSQTSSNAIQNKVVATAIDSLQKSLPQVTSRIYYAPSQTTGTDGYTRLKLSEVAIENDVYSVDKDGTYITLSQGNYLIYGTAVVKNSSNTKTAHHLAFDLNTVGNRISGSLKTFQPSETATLSVFVTISLKTEAKIGMEVNDNPSSVSTLVIYIIKL